MKQKTTEAMRRGLADAVIELRTTLKWRQDQLARELQREVRRAGGTAVPCQEVISRWENAEQAPGEEYRLALSRIAEKRSKHDNQDNHDDMEHLVELFRAPVSAWRVLGRVKLRVKLFEGR